MDEEVRIVYPRNVTKQKLKNGEHVFGISIGEMRSITLPKILAGLGFDFLFLDMEHGAEGWETISELVWASRCAGIAPIVRVPDTERFYISRALDIGAQGVIVPRVETGEQVDTIVGYCKYPPEGDRGAALGGRHSEFQPIGDPRTAMQQANDEILVCIQIETLPGLNRVEELASRPGVDVLFVGPQDMSIALGFPNEWKSAALDEAIRKVVSAAERTNRQVGIQGRNVELSTRWMGYGVRFVVFGSTLMLLTEAARAGMQDLRRVAAAGQREALRVGAK
ncbi:MAG TPA: aldolase/citrate lyase family protein [Terriglobales bacterium]|nr:aldolase/citrate lyase family protein [Terriglobales bacterium]